MKMIRCFGLYVVILCSLCVNLSFASSDVKRNFTPDQSHLTLVCPEIKDHVTGEVHFFTKDNKLQVLVSYINGDDVKKQPVMYYQYTLLGIDSFSTDKDPNVPSSNALVLHMQVLNDEIATITINNRVNGVVQEDWRMCYVK